MCLFTTAACASLRNLRILYHVVVAHKNLGLRAELVCHENAPFIVLIILKLEYEVEPGDFLFYFAVMAPADFIQVLILDETIHEALSELSLAAWKVPLAQSNRLARSGISVVLDHVFGHLNVKERVKRLHWKEGSIP